MLGRDVFLMKPKHQFFYIKEENDFMVPNHWKKGDYYVNSSLSNWKTNLNLKMVKRDAFLAKPKPQYLLSQWGECVYGA